MNQSMPAEGDPAAVVVSVSILPTHGIESNINPPGMDMPDTTTTTTTSDPQPPPSESSFGPRRTGKKSRYPKTKKRELRDLKQQQQQQQQQQDEAEDEDERQNPRPTKKRMRSRNASKRSDALDRLLRCAEECLFTDSIVVENHDEVLTEGSSANVDVDVDANENRPATTESSATLIVRIISGGNRPSQESALSPPATTTTTTTTTTTPEGSEESPVPLPPIPLLSSPGHRIFTRRTTIFVRPLLVLDLNGILCHRYRIRRRPSSGITAQDLRPSVGNIAQTLVVPRSDLRRFLRYLDQHFCLGIWTSARPKTAQLLLKALLAPSSKDDDVDDGADIRSRFLFVWNQKHCNAVRPTGSSNGSSGENIIINNNNNNPDDTIYEKHLPKIWTRYPLWSADNTLLMDDSPEKCPLAVANAVHPPPLDGRHTGSSDASNEATQEAFFRALVGFWKDNPHGSEPWTATASGTATTATTASRGASAGAVMHREYCEFLREHASGHMGWRAPTPTDATNHIPPVPPA